MDPYANRSVYRKHMDAEDLTFFRVTEGETDLYIGAARELKKEALPFVKEARALVTAEIRKRPAFQSSLTPLEPDGSEPALIFGMYEAAKVAGTGPMAAVAGAIAAYTGRALLRDSSEVIVENGGDVFLAGMRSRILSIEAGTSPLTGKIGLRVLPGPGFSVCTSSGTYGHSLSFGRADAAVACAENAALADAVATMLGNRCKSEECLAEAVECAAALPGMTGAAAVIGDKLAIAGKLELVPLG